MWGDSRIYRFRAGQLERLTRDHSQRINRKTIYLTRALGADPSLEIDVHSSEIEVGDLFLLMTDGIHDVLTDHDIAHLCTNWGTDPEELVERITHAAIARQSSDNLSIQACLIVTKGTISKDDSIAALVQLPFPPVMDVGHQLDELRVCNVIHESERSQIYLVEAKDGKRLALKTPSHRYQDDPPYIERFVMESWIGSRIQSSHVVRVVEPPVARSYLYYLTEYIQGPTLAELIRQRAPFDIPDAVEIIEQVVQGVRALHRKETLHQDIKPTNIMVNPKGAVLLDFGSCRVGGITEIKAPFLRDTVLGTFEYSAPEYRCGGGISEAADQFSLGVVLYEMLTGKKPYGERYAEAMDVKSIQKLSYIPATRYNPLVPVWLDKAIEKSVSVSPGRRYEALSEWLMDLRRPNPAWLSEPERPWIERDPLRFWKTCAAVGWMTALLILLVLAEG